MATSVGRSVAGRTIGRRGVNQSDGRSIGRLVESVRRSVGPTITHCPQLTIRYPYPRYPLVEPLSNTSFSCSYPRSFSFSSFLPFFIFLVFSSLAIHDLPHHVPFATHYPLSNYSLFIAPPHYSPLNIRSPRLAIHYPPPTLFVYPNTTHHPLPTTS